MADTPASVAVIVTTYNRPDALEAVLTSLVRQSQAPDEIIVADDGSAPETAQRVANWSKISDLPLTHLWHADRGFRAGAIRNRAVAHARSEYLIFMDGDCLARADFVAMHRALARRGRFVAGHRVLLSQALTERILRDGIDYASSPWRQFFRHRLTGELNRLLPLLRLPGQAWRRLGSTRWEGAKTCNLGLWREDVLRVNGFDESFEGWGFEDSDLVIRLIRAGVRRIDGRFATGVFHLWHRENDRSQMARNLQLLDTVRAGQNVRAKRGIAEAVLAHEPVSVLT